MLQWKAIGWSQTLDQIFLPCFCEIRSVQIIYVHVHTFSESLILHQQILTFSLFEQSQRTLSVCCQTSFNQFGFFGTWDWVLQSVRALLCMALFLAFSKHTVAENLPKVLNVTGFKSDREFEKRPSMMHTLAPSCGRMMELSLMLLETSVPPKVLCWLRSGDCGSCLSTLNSLF